MATGSRLARKTVVVTGASGIAAAGARAFAGQGAAVFVISRSESSCEELVASITAHGGSAGCATADLTDEAMTVDAFASCSREFGSIDGLFAVAGGSGRKLGDGPIHEMSLEGWEQTHEMNGLPAFLAARETVRSMTTNRRGGSIVLITSVLATSPAPEMFATRLRRDKGSGDCVDHGHGFVLCADADSSQRYRCGAG